MDQTVLFLALAACAGVQESTRARQRVRWLSSRYRRRVMGVPFPVVGAAFGEPRVPFLQIGTSL